MHRKPRRTISPERQSSHTIGLVLQGVGIVGVIVCFLGFAVGGMTATASFGREGHPIAWWIGFFAPNARATTSNHGRAWAADS